MVHALIGGGIVATIFGILVFGKTQAVMRLLGVVIIIGIVTLVLMQDPPKAPPPSAAAKQVSQASAIACWNWKKPNRQLTDDELVIYHKQVHGLCGK